MNERAVIRAAEAQIDHNGRRSQARTIDKRLMIEEVATGLFAERGYDGVSMRDIAHAAAVQLGTLTYLYPDKQTIYDAVVSAAIRYFGTPLIDAASSADDARMRLSRFIAALVHLHVRRSPHGQVIARELVDGSRSRMVALGRDTFRSLRALINPAVVELSGRALSDAEADLLTGQIINMSYAATRSQEFYAATHDDAPFDERKYTSDLTRFILNGLKPRT